MGSFLRFVVEEKLADRGDRLKAFSIACEVYGRDENFDPRSDTIVRVDAGRLRHRLASYYKSAGCNDPVRIDVPKGGYSPGMKTLRPTHNPPSCIHWTKPEGIYPDWLIGVRDKRRLCRLDSF
jgi:hypothetical protein